MEEGVCWDCKGEQHVWDDPDRLCDHHREEANARRAEAERDARRCKATTVSEERCTNPAIAGGLCDGHYGRKRRGQPVDGPLRAYAGSTPCPGPGHDGKPCMRPIHALGWCRTHWEQQHAGKLLTPVRAYLSPQERARKALEDAVRLAKSVGLNVSLT